MHQLREHLGGSFASRSPLGGLAKKSKKPSIPLPGLAYYKVDRVRAGRSDARATSELAAKVADDPVERASFDPFFSRVGSWAACTVEPPSSSQTCSASRVALLCGGFAPKPW